MPDEFEPNTVKCDWKSFCPYCPGETFIEDLNATEAQHQTSIALHNEQYHRSAA